MLRSNSKKAIENSREYIVSHFDPCGYDFVGDETDFITAATFIYEKVKHDKRRMSEQALFFEWCSGLPSVIDTCYYYNRSAITDLGIILEETEEETVKFTESQAEERLTWLIYREIKKVVR